VVRAGERRDSTTAFGYVREQMHQFPVAMLCRVLEISRSGFYAWNRRTASARSSQNELLAQHIKAIHVASGGTYGAPRIRADLAEDGTRVSRKRVARIMRQKGIRGVSRRKWITTTVRDGTAGVAPDLVKRDFRVHGPNQLWVADITYIPTWAGFLYLAVVLDAWSRRIVGWAFATHLRVELVLEALDMAVRRRQPQAVIHHSDHGSQYTALAFGNRCRQAGVRPSMGTVGDAYDNAMCESFFATLECELLDRTRYETPGQAEPSVFEFIEGWYNPHRRHSALSHVSPVKFEKMHMGVA
jgi:putative transposase